MLQYMLVQLKIVVNKQRFLYICGLLGTEPPICLLNSLVFNLKSDMFSGLKL